MLPSAVGAQHQSHQPWGLRAVQKPTWPRENELLLGVCFLMAGEHQVQGQADSPCLQLAKQASFFPIFFPRFCYSHPQTCWVWGQDAMPSPATHLSALRDVMAPKCRHR